MLRENTPYFKNDIIDVIFIKCMTSSLEKKKCYISFSTYMFACTQPKTSNAVKLNILNNKRLKLFWQFLLALNKFY